MAHNVGTKFLRTAKILVNIAKKAKRNPSIFGDFSLKIDGFSLWRKDRDLRPHYILCFSEP